MVEITVDKLANAKGFNPAFLRSLGVHNCGKGVKIPYHQEDGSQANRHRLRTALQAGSGSRWTNGEETILPYGLNRLLEARNKKELVLVEGETDAWSCWDAAVPALGIPGATMTGTLQSVHFKEIERILVHQESDEGGEEFVEGVKKRLQNLNWSGELAIFTCPEGDVNDLYQSKGKRGVQEVIRTAREKTGPFPSNSEEKWPDPILPEEPQPAQTFPVEVLPGVAQGYIKEKAEALGTTKTLVAPFVFMTMASSIGASCEVDIKTEWKQSTNLYLLIVSPSGVGKTPAMKGATHPILEHHQRLKEQNQRMKEKYEQVLNNDEEDPPQEPPTRKAFVNDATTEALSRDLQQSPRGITLIMDEASAWTRSMNQYQNGDDREFYLRAWNRDPIETSRKSVEEISVNNPHLSLIGGLVPSSLHHLTPPGESEEDGFLPRILFVYPEVPQTGMTFAEVSQETQQSYRRFIGALYSIEPRKEPTYHAKEGFIGQWEPQRIGLSAEARNAIKDWYDNQMVPRKQETDNPLIQSFLSKLQNHVFRFALILQVAHDQSEGNKSHSITEVNANRATNLAEFFLSNFRRTIQEISLQAEEGNQALKRYVLDKILELESEEDQITERTLWQKTKNKSEIHDTKDVHRILEELDQNECIDLHQQNSNGGRPPSPVINLNPLVKEKYPPKQETKSTKRGEDDPSHETSGTFGIENPRVKKTDDLKEPSTDSFQTETRENRPWATQSNK